MFILTSSVCKSTQCLIFPLTKEGKGGHLFRLTCSVALWGGGDTANKYHWHLWGVITVYRPHCICPSPLRHVLSWSTLLRLQVALLVYYPKWTLCFMHFPGLSHSGSGSRVLHKGTDLVGCAFCAFPRFEQLRRPAALRAHCLRRSVHLNHLPSPGCSVSQVHCESTVLGVPCLLWGADLRLRPSWQMSTIQDPRKTWLAIGSLLTV